MGARLWDKGGGLDALIHRFTVGDDPLLDRELAWWDCIGSAAHARTLARAGLLSGEELTALLHGLAQIAERAQAGRFEITPEQEDCHTAIEAELTRICGDAGAKIHTGRSRNDQVVTAMRLFMRERVLAWLERLDALAGALLARIDRDGAAPMPGYTHMQPAMPSSVGQWLHAFAEATLEQMRAGFDLFDRLDGCPLGTGAGFGVPLPLDRAYTAELLGFSRVQRSPIDVQNGRGRTEVYFVRVAADVGGVLEKLAWDLILFSSSEYGFFALPDEMTTGSSIMPQKRNPDVLELLRARAGALRGRLHELEWIAGKLPSSYHRDLQLTKAPAIRAAGELCDMLAVATRVVQAFTVDRGRLSAAMRPELYATAAAYELVRQGTPFREAYRRVARQLHEGRFQHGALSEESAAAARADPRALLEARAELRQHLARLSGLRSRLGALESLLRADP